MMSQPDYEATVIEYQGRENGWPKEHWKVLSTTMVGRKEKFFEF